MHNSVNPNSAVPTGTDLKNENVAPSPTTTIPTPSMTYNQDLYAKRVNVAGSIHENLTTNNAASSVSQQHDLKLNSTWNPYSDINHTM